MFIGVDVGGTTVKVLLLKDNEIVKFDTVPNNTLSQNSVLDSIKKGINKIVSSEELKKVEAIGLSIAGQVDYENGILKNAPNMPLKNFNFTNFFKEEYNKPSFVDNDVNCAALAETSLYPSISTQIFIFLGTGIGGAAVINGKMLRGSSNLAMEIGHMTYKDGTYLCGCGKRGCYESFAGGKNLIKHYKEEMGLTKDITIIDVEEAFLKKEPVAVKLYEEVLHAISVLTNDLITLLDPDYIIFGGGVIEHSKVIVDSVKEYIQEKIRFSEFSKIKFKESVFKDRSNAYGAIVGYIKKNI